MSGDLSKNFSRYEFACNCHCGFDTVDTELLPVVQGVRNHFNKATFVTSGCRCLKYNKLVGGAKHSKHMWGQAADLQVSGASPKEVADYLDKTYPDKFGIGRYRNFTHVDVRKTRTRWGQN